MYRSIVLLTLLCGVLTNHAIARDQIEIVGSSTVYPFSTVVAEKFGKETKFKTPKIESTGSGGGLKLFCSGVGTKTPDFTNSSRAIKENEIKKCRANGVGDIVEVKVGYDGIVMANAKSSPTFKVTRKDVYLALAAEIPDPSGAEVFIKNPHKTWKDVNPILPDELIEVLGPPPTSGTRDAFVELVLEKGGCKKYGWIKAIKKKDKKLYKAKCHTIREDGLFIEAGENDSLMIQKVLSNPKALAIFGFSFLDQNTDKVKGAEFDGIAPTFENIANGKYSVARPLFFYVKTAHLGVIPGMKEYVEMFLSDAASGQDGYLVDRGLIPMPESERSNLNSKVLSMKLIVGDISPSKMKEKK